MSNGNITNIFSFQLACDCKYFTNLNYLFVVLSSRYVVIYEYGGVYADIDTTCLRPLNRVLNKYACVLSPEPYEHASLIFNTELLVTNSVMFCQPKHLFFKQVLENIYDFALFSQDIDATGPNFLTFQLNIYDTINGETLINKHAQRPTKLGKGISRNKVQRTKHHLLEDSDDFIFIPSSQYFQNSIDPVRFNQFRKLCSKFKKLNNVQKRGCAHLKRRGMKYRTSEFEYTRHSFYHTGYKVLPEGTATIWELVPNARMYTAADQS